MHRFGRREYGGGGGGRGGLILETPLLSNRGFGVQTVRRWILLWLHWYPPLSTEIMGFADTSLSPDV